MVSGATCGEFYNIGEPHEITRCNLVWRGRRGNLVSRGYSSSVHVMTTSFSGRSRCVQSINKYTLVYYQVRPMLVGFIYIILQITTVGYGESPSGTYGEYHPWHR